MPGVDSQKAFVLHYRSYRETSLLVDLLTQNSGRVSVIARGAKRPKSSFRGILQPFIPLEITYRGRGELPTLCSAENLSAAINLVHYRLYSGFYLNELLTRVLHKHDPCESVFVLYEQTLQALVGDGNNEIILRKFEKKLLQELGYELQLTHLIHSDTPIKEHEQYYLTSDRGFAVIASQDSEHIGSAVFCGESLLKIDQDDFATKEILRDAKRLMRLAFRPLLGNKPLKSREMFK